MLEFYLRQTILLTRKTLYLTMNSTHFILQLFGVEHMVKNHSVREETHFCHFMGYSFRLAGRDLLYVPSHRQDSTYHSICHTSCGALAGNKNSSIQKPITPWVNTLPWKYISLLLFTKKLGRRIAGVWYTFAPLFYKCVNYNYMCVYIYIYIYIYI